MRTENENMVVLVTGSSGRLGAPLVRRLALSRTVIGFDRDGDPHPPKEAECVCVDVSSEASVESGLKRVRYAHGDRIASVVHLAAFYDFSGEPSPKYEEVTVRGTERLLRGLQSFEVDQFIFSSTMLVHAPCEPGERINEESPLEPKWDYPQSKVDTEEVLKEWSGNIPIVTLRIAGVYDDQCHSIPLANQIQRIYQKKLTSRVFPGDISHGQAFLHLEDFLDAVECVVNRRSELAPEATFLIGEEKTLSYDHLQKSFGELIHGRPWKTRQIPKWIAKGGAWVQDVLPFYPDPFIKPWMVDLADDHYELDIGRAKQSLDWNPKRSLQDALPTMVESLRNDPLGFYREHGLRPPSRLARSD